MGYEKVSKCKQDNEPLGIDIHYKRYIISKPLRILFSFLLNLQTPWSLNPYRLAPVHTDEIDTSVCGNHELPAVPYERSIYSIMHIWNHNQTVKQFPSENHMVIINYSPGIIKLASPHNFQGIIGAYNNNADKA